MTLIQTLGKVISVEREDGKRIIKIAVKHNWNYFKIENDFLQLDDEIFVTLERKNV